MQSLSGRYWLQGQCEGFQGLLFMVNRLKISEIFFQGKLCFMILDQNIRGPLNYS